MTIKSPVIGKNSILSPPSDKVFKPVVISDIFPLVDGGVYPIKRVQGEWVEVSADIFAHGHDLVTARLLYRYEKDKDWKKVPMTSLGNDRWLGKFLVSNLGFYYYTVEGWIDHFTSWVERLRKKVVAGDVEEIELEIGSSILKSYLQRAEEVGNSADCSRLKLALQAIYEVKLPIDKREMARLERLVALAQRLVRRYPNPDEITRYSLELRVRVEIPRARFSAWYELFPRSWSKTPGQHGRLEDLIDHLPYIAEMGFDVIYLPPIHPIGKTHRKGRNNALEPEPDAPGSPWAIGSPEGGHKSVHPQLGTINDFRRLVETARSQYGIEIALDIALHCSPDHPYLKEHPEWFFHRPDGTLAYAENPPKKYQDIYPFNFETPAWESLWRELFSIFEYWIEQG
ncbi:MAG: maltotransferase domain-containing protein, partial [bacterium]